MSSIKDILHRVANAYAPGDAEFEKVLNAIALAESGGRPDARGDGGFSIGLFQNHMRDGRGKGYTEEQLLDPLFNATLAAKELIKFYNQGKQKGITGANLATYVSRYGQRPAPGNEVHAGKNYGRMVGEAAVSTNEPHMMQNGLTTMNPERITTEQLQRNQAANLQRLTDQRNREIQNQAINQPGFGEVGKPKGILDVLNFLFSAATPKVYASEKIPMSSQTNPQAMNYNPPQSSTGQYVVKPNDTLWGIAQNTLGSGNRWKELGYAGNPNTMPIGTKLNIPQPAKAPASVVNPHPSSPVKAQQSRSMFGLA